MKDNIIRGYFPKFDHIVSIQPLSAVDLIKSIGKEADIYSELCQVLTANEYMTLMYPSTTRGKLERSDC